MSQMLQRPRRNRKSRAIRALVAEHGLTRDKLIAPLFVAEGLKGRSEILSMPGQFRLAPEELLREVESCLKLGISSFALFPVILDQKKDSYASEGLREDGFYSQVIRRVKREFSEATVITDVAMDPYSSDGHDGLVIDGKVVNDKSVEILANMAIVQAAAGADIVGPSDMMDGRVLAIRQALDGAGYSEVSIMAYTAKYASSFYGPFRDALDSAPRSGDKKTYQMDFRNRREALREAHLDVDEGADFIMVKPALSYLDVISDLASSCSVPVAAYNVSGEYAMIKAAAQMGWLKEDAAVDEVLTSIHRAGAQVILSYFAKSWAERQKEIHG